MGFRNNAYATVWSVEPGKTDKVSRARISINRKNKETGEYQQDFSGFCTLIGSANTKGKNLMERDRIKIISCDVSNSYNKETGVTYTDFKIFDFEMADGGNTGAPAPAKKTAFDEVEDGDTGDDFDETDDEGEVPF